ncbi:hypothetical protein EJB05_45804 [Eragrostis curvula]|uniref:No apical meristem-associated C-terminal domain-containing protein n=1 Tax=Eragrostis curvula TaxID=38414 RepID=A0A5J9TLI5_9POAL|nr:hypothetical protein EJB05_45804 [Eragrostis curvula]
MSIPTHRASKQSQIPVMKPPPPRGSTPSRVGLPIQAPQFLMPQFPERQSSIGGEGATGMDLLRHRVIPPAGLGGRLQQFVADPVQAAHEEFSAGATSSSYFTNLMSNGIPDPEVYAADQTDVLPLHGPAGPPDDLPPPNEGAGQGHAQGVAKGPQKRTKNFSVDEDLLLVSAWLNVSLDPIQGVDQSRSTYWKRIHDYFHANKTFDSDRTQGSLMNRWSGIQHDVNVFAGCLSKIETRNQSGCSVDDKVWHHCTIFIL